jgi:hypothetical protein
MQIVHLSAITIGVLDISVSLNISDDVILVVVNNKKTNWCSVNYFFNEISSRNYIESLISLTKKYSTKSMT